MARLPLEPLNVKHWRDRAEEAYTYAERLTDAEDRLMMLDVAAGYEKIAQRVERRRCTKS